MPSTILQTQPFTAGAPLFNATTAVPHHSSEIMEEQQAMEDIVSLGSSEERERRQFNQDVHNFMAEIGKPLSKIPIMGYKELDLFQLFKEVMSYGGFNEVVKNVGTWSKIWKRLGNFDPSITDSSFRLKKNYERYLLEYEFKCFPDRRQQVIEHEKQVQMKKSHVIADRPHSPSSLAGLSSSSDSSSPTSSPELSFHSSGGYKNKKSKKSSKKLSMSGSFPELERINGVPKLPFVCGDVTIERLGFVINRSPYVTEKQVWPITFCSTSYYQSMINPNQTVKYTSEIIDLGDKPQFVVTASDDLNNPITAHSPSAAWKLVLKRISRGEDSSKKLSINGTLRFGLTLPIVAALVKELPNYPELMVPSSPESDGRRKRKHALEDENSHDVDEMSAEECLNIVIQEPMQKIPRVYEDRFSARTVNFETRDEMDDLESAVATLEALKHCVVY